MNKNQNLSELNHSTLETELVVSALDGVLTESRYNEILDALLSTVSDSPEATAMLKGFGNPEWQERRHNRTKFSSSAA
jgi:hypothetical protein